MSEKLNIRSFGRWAHTECDECGSEFQVTRTEAKEVQGKLVCNDCEMYERGYKDALHVAPEGYALVPVEPTLNIVRAGYQAEAKPAADMEDIYKAMIKAAQESK